MIKKRMVYYAIQNAKMDLSEMARYVGKDVPKVLKILELTV